MLIALHRLSKLASSGSAKAFGEVIAILYLCCFLNVLGNIGIWLPDRDHLLLS